MRARLQLVRQLSGRDEVRVRRAAAEVLGARQDGRDVRHLDQCQHFLALPLSRHFVAQSVQFDAGVSAGEGGQEAHACGQDPADHRQLFKVNANI